MSITLSLSFGILASWFPLLEPPGSQTPPSQITSLAEVIFSFVLATINIWRCSLNWMWNSPSLCASHPLTADLPDPRTPSRRILKAGGWKQKGNKETCINNTASSFWFSVGLYLKGLSLCNKLDRVVEEGVSGVRAGEVESPLTVFCCYFICARLKNVVVF